MLVYAPEWILASQFWSYSVGHYPTQLILTPKKSQFFLPPPQGSDLSSFWWILLYWVQTKCTHFRLAKTKCNVLYHKVNPGVLNRLGSGYNPSTNLRPPVRVPGSTLNRALLVLNMHNTCSRPGVAQVRCCATLIVQILVLHNCCTAVAQLSHNAQQLLVSMVVNRFGFGLIG